MYHSKDVGSVKSMVEGLTDKQEESNSPSQFFKIWDIKKS